MADPPKQRGALHSARVDAMMRPAQILMCPPTWFDVHYSINPWMKPDGVPVDRARALAQWTALGYPAWSFDSTCE